MKTRKVKHLKKWARILVQAICIITFMMLAMMNDFECSIVGIATVLTVLGLFIGSSYILHIDNSKGW